MVESGARSHRADPQILHLPLSVLLPGGFAIKVSTAGPI